MKTSLTVRGLTFPADLTRINGRTIEARAIFKRRQQPGVPASEIVLVGRGEDAEIALADLRKAVEQHDTEQASLALLKKR